MSLHTGLDAHAAPPPGLRQIFKRYQSATVDQLDGDADIIDFKNGLDLQSRHGISQIGTVNSAELASMCARFEGNGSAKSPSLPEIEDCDRPILHVDSVPGLILIPSLLPPSTQLTLLNRLLHRDASSPSHGTNVHLHHQLPSLVSTPSSFFTLSPISPPLPPLNPSTHKPLPIPSFLYKKLRWITLGAQYDWTSKTYPTPNSPNTPSFPPDLTALLTPLFPQTTPHAAIINIYSPGHTLSLHRDLSEASPAGLISLSLGCDCIFVIAPDPPLPSSSSTSSATPPHENNENNETNNPSPTPHATLRLRSGDAVYMSAAARYAWHGVAKIVGGTCPAWMAEWPGGGLSVDGVGEDEDQRFEAWKGWMEGKRVNLNVRQMWDGNPSGEMGCLTSPEERGKGGERIDRLIVG